MSNIVIPLILSGGSGSRLWPLSNKSTPKQFISLLGKESLLQETLSRLRGIKNLSAPIVVCNNTHRTLVAEQLEKIGMRAETIILEPCGRNTAPAVAVAAMQALAAAGDQQQEQDIQEPILLVLPSDHAIKNQASLHAAIATAVRYAENNFLVTFGVKPTRPETGYGYIQAGAEQIGKDGGYPIARFVEKPDLVTAEKYLASPNYYWNSGMFVFKASVFLKELQTFAPEVFAACARAVECMSHKHEFLLLPQDEFAKSPSISLDYAVMEKTARAAVIPLDAGWSDVGTWNSLWEYGEKDAGGNVVIGNAIAHETKNSYIHSTSKRIVAMGADDCIIVETDKAILVMPKSKCQDIKSVVENFVAGGE